MSLIIKHQSWASIMPPPKETKPLLYHISNAPDNVALIRQKLFEVVQTVTLSLEEYNSYWPYVDIRAPHVNIVLYLKFYY